MTALVVCCPSCRAAIWAIRPEDRERYTRKGWVIGPAIQKLAEWTGPTRHAAECQWKEGADVPAELAV